MIKNNDDSIIDIDRKITLFDDTFWLAYRLRGFADDEDDGTEAQYILREAAQSLEGLYSAYRSALFQEE